MRTDAELLLAWQAGDRDAGGALVDRYFEPLRRFFRNKVSNGVEDLIQQTLLACVQQRDRIRDPGAFRGYLFAAARSKLFEHIGRRVRSPIAPDFAVSSVADLGVSPSGVIADQESQQLLLRALRTLPLELQIALELYYVEQVRGRDLELALELPSGTVRSRLRRGLEQLRRNLAQIASSPDALRETTDDIERWAADLGNDE